MAGIDEVQGRLFEALSEIFCDARVQIGIALSPDDGDWKRELAELGKVLIVKLQLRVKAPSKLRERRTSARVLGKVVIDDGL